MSFKFSTGANMSDLDTFEEMIFTDFFNIYSTLYMKRYSSESDDFAAKFDDLKKQIYDCEISYDYRLVFMKLSDYDFILESLQKYINRYPLSYIVEWSDEPSPTWNVFKSYWNSLLQKSANNKLPKKELCKNSAFFKTCGWVYDSHQGLDDDSRIRDLIK